MDISFIVPAYNEETTLGKSLEAIFAELKNNPQIAGEVIVVNNASTDNTKQVAVSFPQVRIVDENRKGLVFARAAGAAAASGELLAHIDADCLLRPGWLKTVVEEFAANKNLVALSGPQYYYDYYKNLSWFKKLVVKTYHLIFYWVYLANRHVFRIGSIIQGGNFVVRAWAWKKMGSSNSEINFYGEDTDLCQRLFKIGDVKFLPKLEIWASGRRLQKEGMAKTALTYIFNYYSILFFKKPATKKYSDVRLG